MNKIQTTVKIIAQNVQEREKNKTATKKCINTKKSIKHVK